MHRIMWLPDQLSKEALIAEAMIGRKIPIKNEHLIVQHQ